MKLECFEMNEYSFMSKEGVLLCSKAGDKTNVMTIGWGMLGSLWGKSVVCIFLKEQRYSKKLIDKSNSFSINVLPCGNAEITKMCGTVSGANVDKLSMLELEVLEKNDIPYIKDAVVSYFCRVIYSAPICEENFVGSAIINEKYKKEFRYLYIAEVVDL